MADLFAEFRKAIEAHALKENFKLKPWLGARQILEINTAPQPTVLYVKISNSERGFWGLNTA